MVNILVFCAVLAAGYVIGSVPFGYIIGRVNGKDIRKEGSGNIGATNVTRVIGPWAGKLCFLLDFCKGLAPVLLVKLLILGKIMADPVWGLAPVLMIFAVVLGHMFTCFLNFKGGKGIATAVGGVAAVAPIPALAAFVIWLAVFKISGYVSLGSIVAAVALPVLVWLTGLLKIAAPQPWSVIAFFVLLALVAVWTHRSNIKRLLAGTENSFKKK